ncbi:MAG TPA: T9SS type A sorting domain-containing protein, partial [Bacteroidia bacterium]|nr:T9SS type A sorting domain-containing protein [Bacteroidia bacterium]
MVHIEGPTITSFTHQNSGLLDNTQVGIVKDSGDDLWIATPSNGLTYYQNLVFLSYNMLNSSNPTMSHSCVVLDGSEAKWAGSLDKGVVYYDSPTWAHYDESNSDIPQDYVRCLAHDPATGLIWGGTEQRGVFVLDPDVITAADAHELADGFEVFPNPAVDQLHFATGFDRLTIADLGGKVVMTVTRSVASLDISPLPAGAYLLMAQKGQRQAKTKLMIAR